MLKGYGEYKEISLPWLKMIPLHWDTRRAKSIFITAKSILDKTKEAYHAIPSSELENDNPFVKEILRTGREIKIDD